MNILDLVLLLLLLFILTILAISLVLVGVRFLNVYKLSKFSNFSDKWEPRLFAFLESEEPPKEFLRKLKSNQVSNFLKLIRNYLNLLTGHDFERLKGLLESKKITNYLNNSLKSGRIKKNIEALYYLGIFKNASFKKGVVEYLHHRNDEIFSHAARSLARMDAKEYIEDILRLWPLHKKVSKDTLYSILIEFKKESCSVMKHELQKTSDDDIRTIILAVFTHFKYSKATNIALDFLLFSHTRALLIQSMKYFELLEFRDASNALRLIFIKSSPELISQAIKTAIKISNPELEKIILEEMNNFNWQNKIDAINALYEMSPDSKEKLEELSNNLDYLEAASIAKMVLSERELIES
jgi:hypothetical protein